MHQSTCEGHIPSLTCFRDAPFIRSLQSTRKADDLNPDGSSAQGMDVLENAAARLLTTRVAESALGGIPAQPPAEEDPSSGLFLNLRT